MTRNARYRAFPASYEQSDAIVEAMASTDMSWSELQDQVTRAAMHMDYGLIWPKTQRQYSHGLRARNVRQTSIRGEFVVFGHTISNEQDAILRNLAEGYGMIHGWYTAFLELAMRKHFQAITGLPWPRKRRLAEEVFLSQGDRDTEINKRHYSAERVAS